MHKYQIRTISPHAVIQRQENIFNRRYIQYAAGPTMGALYYAAITVEGLMKQK